MWHLLTLQTLSTLEHKPAAMCLRFRAFFIVKLLNFHLNELTAYEPNEQIDEVRLDKNRDRDPGMPEHVALSRHAIICNAAQNWKRRCLGEVQ